MRVLIVQNEETESLGLYVQFLSEEGMGLQVVHAYGIKPDAPFPPGRRFRRLHHRADAYPMELKAVGKPRELVVEECREREPEMRGLARLLIDNFLNMGWLP